jgi:phosphoenolpyruvate synthase/pyruvate phosphate dikinase
LGDFVTYLTWLDEPICQEVALTGGKAANLSKLAARYPVPPGFCLTTQAYSQWNGADYGAATLRELLATAYAGLAERTSTPLPRVAVRSSAVGEDSHDASFAGQYETFLNVAGVESLTDAVLRCWALAQSERVAVYQQQKKGAKVPGTFCPSGSVQDIPANEVREVPGTLGKGLAVLVQAQVAADSSFVAFSADPISSDRKRVVINANWGLGESVVSGLATPDAYTVDKASGARLGLTPGAKECMTIAGEDGTRTVTTPRFLRARAALSETQVAAVTQLAIKLESEMGWPVDIEGAFQGDKLYLLQCRPISTIK